MDDEYVSIFLWNDDVGMLPETKAKDSVAAGIVPIVGRIVKGIRGCFLSLLLRTGFTELVAEA